MKLDSDRSSTARDETSSASAPSFARAGSQSRAARSGVFSSSLEAIGERLNPSTWFAREANRTPKAAVSRLREVLDRDRALVAANPELNALDEDILPSPAQPVVAPTRTPLAAPAHQATPSAEDATIASVLPAPAVAAVAPVPAVAAVAMVPAVATMPAAAAAPATQPAAWDAPPSAPVARAAVASTPAPNELVTPPRARSAAPLGAFSEAPLTHYAPEARPTSPAAFAPPVVLAPASPTAAPALPSVVASRVVMVCNEPIRTRTMARLLASQGHRERALSIYEYLLSRNSNDEILRAEADALRIEVI